MRQKRKEEKELFYIKDCEKNPWERMKHTGTEKMASESKWNLTFSVVLFNSQYSKTNVLQFNWG